MAIKLSMINMKGGVGKSTLAVNLAWHFAGYDTWKGKRILLIDLDPQFNASQYLLGVEKYSKIIENKEETVFHIFEQHNPSFKEINLDNVIKSVVHYTDKSTIDILPAQLELAYTLKNPGDKVHNLKKYLDKVEQNYDIVIIDCSPTDSILTEAAYLCSDYVIVPVRPEYLSSIGLPLLYQSIQEHKRKYPDSNIEIAGIVFNATDDYSPEEDKSKINVSEVAETLAIQVFENEISFSRSYAKGARENKPIFRTSYARWEKSNEFLRFTKELAGKVGIK